MIGTPIAALFTGSAFMSVVTTSAMAIAIGSALTGYPLDAIAPALVTLALVIGAVQTIAGLLRLGFLMRFVSNSVMTGFLTGVAILIILGQLADLTGYRSIFSNKLLETCDLLLHPNQVDQATLLVGLVTVALIVGLAWTRLANFAMLIALVAAGLLVWLFHLESVALVGDSSDIPTGLPRPLLPQLLLASELILAGIAVAIIGLVQGAGISSSYPNPNGSYPDISRDFFGQGLGNLAVSLFRGLPVGGSISSTALVVSAGAKSRLANVFTGLFALVAVALLGNLIERLPSTALAAMLVVAGVQSINPARIRTVWTTNSVARAVMLFTLGMSLIVPIQVAVFLGVGLHILLFVFQSAEHLTIVELRPHGDGLFEERPTPDALPSRTVTIRWISRSRSLRLCFLRLSLHRASRRRSMSDSPKAQRRRGF